MKGYQEDKNKITGSEALQVAKEVKELMKDFYKK